MARTPSTMLELGTPAPDFALAEPRSGDVVSLDEVAGDGPFVVAFWCNHCPFVKHIRDVFVDFAAEAQGRGVGVVAISANDIEAYPQDGPEAMAAEAADAGFTFPYLLDETQEVAKAYRAACTPDLFLFDGDRQLVYRGQFDDARPGNGRPVTGADLRAAVDAVLAGGTPDPEAQVPSMGCNIKWRRGNEPDYYGA